MIFQHSYKNLYFYLFLSYPFIYQIIFQEFNSIYYKLQATLLSFNISLTDIKSPEFGLTIIFSANKCSYISGLAITLNVSHNLYVFVRALLVGIARDSTPDAVIIFIFILFGDISIVELTSSMSVFTISRILKTEQSFADDN